MTQVVSLIVGIVNQDLLWENWVNNFISETNLLILVINTTQMSEINNKILHEKLKNFYDNEWDYHTLKFADGYLLKGRYDMDKYLENFHIPSDLNNKTVLEIGTANGYFAFEFAKRGAKVTAIDLHDYSWKEANQLMKTDVKFMVKDFRTIDETFGKFDIVFCSNVLQHNSDMIDIIEQIKKMTKTQAIIGVNVFTHPKYQEIPFAKFSGESHYNHGILCGNTFWIPNIECVRSMLEFAGFKKIIKFPIFTMEHNLKKESQSYAVLHGFI